MDPDALHEQARARLPTGVYDYYAGGAETETTLGESTESWGRWRLRPHMLRDVSAVSTATTLLGTPVSMPIGVAPWALQGMAHPEGERATARGTAAAGTIMTVSTTATASLAEVAAASEAPKWFQLYRVQDRDYTDDLVRRAAAAGYRALVLTVDLPFLGRRLRDLVNAFELPAGITMANHPAEQAYGGRSLDLAMGTTIASTWTFDDVSHFAGLTPMPVVVKGILRGDDAQRSIGAGASAIWVSTHGGRQVDRAIASALALPEIVAAVGPDVEVYVDGGVRRGSDVLTALALGARAVFLGRPTIWGLVTGGADGVRDVLTELAAALHLTMALCGVTDVQDIPPGLVVRDR
ncbi:MAG: alpha-hydroxy-acid oxidizing protein [Geodermatophilaceae bacterium]|nr:alpha-hydroxy-acid oxidizing protein [Geodermatophilaceae bacterium]